MAWSHLISIFDGYENQPLNELVTFTPPVGTVDSYSVSYTLSDAFTCTATSSGIQCTDSGGVGAYLTGLFPLQYIAWITERGGSIGSGTSFNDVPFEAFMQSVKASDVKLIEIPITCTCNYTDDLFMPQVDVAVIPIIISQHYDTIQLGLLEKVGESNVPTS